MGTKSLKTVLTKPVIGFREKMRNLREFLDDFGRYKHMRERKKISV